MDSIKVKRLVVGMLETNCYIVYDENTKEGFCIDPGGSSASILGFIKEKKIEIKGILLTHGHFDHINALEAVKEFVKVPVYISEVEKLLLSDPDKNLSGQFGRDLSLVADVYLKDGEIITTDSFKIHVINTPGHTKGSVCFYIKESHILFSGDTLFANSVGRTDLPTGEMESLCESIQQKIYKLPKETKVYPGHGETTSVDTEIKYNKFC
jgi:glyoxylase-like metal-dependent hydrolase (beta-lactamase superfamily II)